MRKRRAAILLCVILTGCTRVIDDGRPQAAPPAPITAGQVNDLLSEKAEPEDDPNLFATAEPDECAGLIQEVDAPFLFSTTPAAHAGEGWSYEGNEIDYYSTWEMAAVYRAGFDPEAALDEARRTIESCEDEMMSATAQNGAVQDFFMEPHTNPAPPGIVLWSVTGSWTCDTALVAAHNAAVEITTCGEFNGYDNVVLLAQDALKRIEALANMRA
jgi:hypothetical protein